MSEAELECCESVEIHQDRLKIVSDQMPEEEELYDLAELFKVFGDSTRIRILFVLFEAEVCVCDLAEALHMTQPAISHQLKIYYGRKHFAGWLVRHCICEPACHQKDAFYSLIPPV